VRRDVGALKGPHHTAGIAWTRANSEDRTKKDRCGVCLSSARVESHPNQQEALALSTSGRGSHVIHRAGRVFHVLVRPAPRICAAITTHTANDRSVAAQRSDSRKYCGSAAERAPPPSTDSRQSCHSAAEL